MLIKKMLYADRPRSLLLTGLFQLYADRPFLCFCYMLTGHEIPMIVCFIFWPCFCYMLTDHANPYDCMFYDFFILWPCFCYMLTGQLLVFQKNTPKLSLNFKVKFLYNIILHACTCKSTPLVRLHCSLISLAQIKR